MSSTNDEPPLPRQTASGVTLRFHGVDFYPGNDPEQYARRKARVFSPLPRSLVFVPSVGLGYGLADLLQALPADAAILCVEAFPEVMAGALAAVPRDPRLCVVRTQDPEAAAVALRRLGTGRFRRVMEIPLCAGYRTAPEVYSGIRTRLEQEIARHWQNRLTMIAMGSLQVRNLLSNLGELPDAADFSRLATDLPVVVAGAGPSLAASLPLLCRLRERFALVAVDTALATLHGAGIVPDLVVAVEAQAVNNKDFIPRPAGAVRLACDLSVHPSAARLFPGRAFFFSSEFAPLRLWDRLDGQGLRPFPFPALGSVGVAAVHAAVRLGPGPVVLTGLDFSFPRKQTHARGSPFSVAALAACARLLPPGQDAFQALAARRLISRTDKQGQPVLTDRVLSSYRDSLESEVQHFPGRFFDCGVTGLPLGAKTVSEEEVAALLPSAPPAGERIRVREGQEFTGTALRPFLSGERARLADFLRDPDGSRLADIDYTWAHFPDEPDLSSPGPGFLARARVAALYYDERLRRIEEARG
ncbi:MAG TPA: 6-hydroxymethylpterin diphosphokinase MptE-like protein [Spirochaetia bacterium]|nr:6-hydroxymethylpterin diphosphokinase MptE-like protein [Spirochaetia bacterium]